MNAIITGPLLRKVTPESVSVFLAFKEFRRIKLKLYNDPKGTGKVITETENDPKRIGKKLWVIVITLKNLSLVLGQNYYYNISLDDGFGGPTEDLNTLGFLESDNAVLGLPLGYETGHLPGFAIPPGLENLSIIHGSCRKPHGTGSDQLAQLDELIKAKYQDPLTRPHQLFLTGDQIYADDVAVELFEILTMEGVNLLGIREAITPSAKHGGTETQAANRKHFVESATKLSSSHNDYHLVYLSEFYSMYLFAWSGYPLTLADLKKEHPFPPYEIVIPSDVPGTAVIESELTTYAHTLPQVRRALANIPTFMMFDDHEVTDDWYIHGDWKNMALSDETTRKILRNGLVAYAIFQDWGNQPEKYEDDHGAFWKAVEYHEVKDDKNKNEKIIKAFRSGSEANQLNIFLGLVPEPEPEINPKPPRVLHPWYYQLSFLEHNVYVIDTRTRRHYIDNYTMLIAPLAFNDQLPIPTETNKLAVVLSPAPIIGMPVIEDLQRFAVKEMKILKATTLDDEAWTSDPLAYNLLLEHLAQYKKAIILSGDVHYAYTNTCAFFPGVEASNEAARIVQLCSSSLKNGGILSDIPTVIDFSLDEESFALYASADVDNQKISKEIERLREGHRHAGGEFPQPDFRIKSYVKLNPRPGSIKIFSCIDIKNFEFILNTGMTVNQTRARYLLQYLNHDLAEQYDRSTYAPDILKKILGNTNVGQISFETEGDEMYVVHQLHLRVGGSQYKKSFTCRTSLSLPKLNEKPPL